MLIVRFFSVWLKDGQRFAGNKIINNWISEGVLPRLDQIFSAGFPLGGAVSGPIVGLLALSWAGARISALFSYLARHGCCSGTLSLLDKPAMSKRTAPEERIDFENHEDVILSDDGRAAPSLGVHETTNGMGDSSGFSSTTIFFSS